MNSILQLPCLGAQANAPFPSTRDALDSPNGLLAWGGALQPARLLNAYRLGIFPWYSEGQPILWWSPVPRCVIFPDKVYLSKRTRRRYNSGVYRLTADSAFTEVIHACAAPRDDGQGSWITPDMVEAYCQLHHLGHAHSLEVWEGRELVGGIYGLAIGSVFFGESMFSTKSDASKIALVALCRYLQHEGYAVLDCQVGNPHLYRMGAEDLSRETFDVLLKGAAKDARAAQSWHHAVTFEARW